MSPPPSARPGDGPLAEAFHDALELPSARRDDFLLDRFPTAEVLRSRVRALLHADADPPLGFSGLMAALTQHAAEGSEIHRTPGPDRCQTEAARLQAVAEAVAGRFRIEAVVGRGGMATVLRAVDLRHDRPVALKVSHLAPMSEVNLLRFSREVGMVGRLQHPHIVPLFDSGVAGGVPYFVMPFADGESLKQRLARSGQLPLDEALTITTHVASALDYAHARGIVHRDIKPGNILLHGGHALVTDFGIAFEYARSDTALALTGPHVAFGTPRYMSPEQRQIGAAVDGRSDVFALALVFVEMITGVPPSGPRLPHPPEWTGAGGVRADLESSGPLPAPLLDCVARALEEDPSRRFATAGGFARALAAGAGMTGPDAVAGIGVRPGRDRSRRTARWRVGAMSLLAIAAVAYASMSRLLSSSAGTSPASGSPADRQTLVVADFENHTTDPALGRVVAVALQTDLQQSPAISILSGGQLDAVLIRMGHPAPAALTTALAREVAAREGVGLVEGEVGAVGDAVVLTARIVDAQGSILASMRQTATDRAHVVAALEALSHDLRTAIGESVGSINRTPRLASVTTASLEALRSYTEALDAYHLGEARRAIDLLEHAVAQDADFAMAYRKLAAVYSNQGRNADSRSAATRAHDLSHRLTGLERDLATAFYQHEVLEDRRQAIRTYRAILRYAPDEPVAIANLSWMLRMEGNYRESIDVLSPHVDGVAASDFSFGNLLQSQMALGEYSDAARTLDLQARLLPRETAFGGRARVAARTGRVQEAHAWADSLDAAGRDAAADYFRWASDLRAGRAEEAVQHMTQQIARLPDSAVADIVEGRVWRAVALLQVDTVAARVQLSELWRDAVSGAVRDDRISLERVAWAWWLADPGLDLRALEDAAASLGRARLLDYIRLLRAIQAGKADEALYARLDAICVHCQRREAAEMASSSGNVSQAIARLEEIIRVPGVDDLDALFEPLHRERLAQLLEQARDPSRAAAHYLGFADLWSAAETPLQPRVQAARRRAAQLMGRPGGT